MIDDVTTMAWKEFKELLGQRSRFKGGVPGMLLFVGVMGVYIPLMMGRSFIETPYMFVFWAWMPLLLVIGMVADAFAGERERHTLETLLASRLPDVAILLGKILAAVLYGWGTTLLLLLVGLVSVNVATWNGSVGLFDPAGLAFIVIMALLSSGLMASLGVLISLRAPTVRQAQQTLGVVIIVIAAIPFLLFFVLPGDWKDTIIDGIIRTGVPGLAAASLVVLAILNAGVLYLAVTRFKRNLLIAS